MAWSLNSTCSLSPAAAVAPEQCSHPGDGPACCKRSLSSRTAADSSPTLGECGEAAAALGSGAEAEAAAPRSSSDEEQLRGGRSVAPSDPEVISDY